MKMIFKVVRWTALILVGVILLSIAGLWLFFPIEKAKNMAIEKGSAELGREITIASADISFWGGIGIQLQDVGICNPDSFSDSLLLYAENIDVKLQMLPLIIGDVVIDRLILNKPDIKMVKSKDGTNNFSFKTLEKKAPPEIVESTTPEQKAAAAAISFDKFEINEGHLVYSDNSSDVMLEIDGLELTTSLSHDDNGIYQSSGEIEIAVLNFNNSLQLPVLKVGIKYEAEYNINSSLVKLGNLSCDINGSPFEISGEMAEPFGKIKSNLNVKTECIAIVDLLTILPKSKQQLLEEYSVDGNLAFDVDINYGQSGDDPLKYYGTAVISDMNASHNDIPGKFAFDRALLDFKNDNLRFNIEDGTFDEKPVKGHLTIDNFSDPTINGAFTGSLNLVYLKPFLPVENNHLVAGRSDIDVKFSGKLAEYEQMRFSGNLTASEASYNSDLMLVPIDTLELDIYFDNNLVSVKKLKAKTKSGSLDFTGRFNNVLQYVLADSIQAKSIRPTIDGTLKGDLDLSVLTELLPSQGNPELAGEFVLDLTLSGAINDLGQLEPRGTVAIRNGSYIDSLLPEPIKQFDAQLTISPDTVTVHKFFTQFESSDASFAGKLIRPFPYLLPLKSIDRSKLEKPLFIFTLTSSRFDVDRLFPEVVPGSGENRTEASIDSVSAVILPDIDGRGKFVVDTLIYSKVEMTSIKGKVKIHDRKIECYEVTGEVYSGTVSGKTTIDLNDITRPIYVGEFNASQIEANDFASRFSKFENMLYGKVDLKGTYNAVGWEPEEFLNSLTMNSTSSMVQGKVMTSGVVSSSISSVVEKFGQTYKKEQPIRNLLTNIIVKDGKISFDKLKSRLSNYGDIEIDGFYSFNGDISYNGSILLTENMTEKLVTNLGDVSQFLTGKNSIGRIKLPLSFGGTIDKPEFKVDLSGLTKDLGKNLLEDLGNQLFKKK